MHNLRVKNVLRWSDQERVFRVARWMWETGSLEELGAAAGRYPPPGWYSSKLSLAFQPKLFVFRRGYWDYHLTLLGIRLHYQRSYGGRHV